MDNAIRRTIVATLILLTGACAHAPQSLAQTHQDQTAHPVTQQVDSLASIFERCWRAEEIGASRDVSFQQDVGLFRGEVRLHWCRATLEVSGPVERRANRDYFARIDSLTLHLRTDTIIAELRERAGEPSRLTVNGHAAKADWWRGGSRERVLRLARVPLL
jgi:hypothetical protein